MVSQNWIKWNLAKLRQFFLKVYVQLRIELHVAQEDKGAGVLLSGLSQGPLHDMRAIVPRVATNEQTGARLARGGCAHERLGRPGRPTPGAADRRAQHAEERDCQ